MRRRMLSFAAGIVVLLLFAPSAFSKSYQASRFDVSLGIAPGGDLLVTEQVDFQFEGGPFTYVFREIPTQESDGLDQFQGFMDGQKLEISAGEMPGLELRQNDKFIRVTWHFRPTSDSSHTFVVSFRARGAVRRQDGQDLLLWKAVPPNHPYRIESSRIGVRLPPGVRLAGNPDASRATTVKTSGQEISYQAERLNKNQGITIRVPMVGGSILSAPPLWQQEALRRSSELKEGLLIAAAIAIPLFLVGVLLIVRLRGSTPRPVAPSVATSPPDDLHPALVGVLRGSWSDWRVALATLIDLSERGFLEVIAQPKRWWGREFTLRRKGDAGALTQSEQVLLRLVFGTTQSFAGEVPIRKAQRLVWRRWGQFKSALREEALSAGFLDLDRESARRKWIVAGIATILLAGAATMISLSATMPQGRPMPIVVTAALGVTLTTLGLFVVILGTTLTRLTDQALARKQSWNAFRRHLKQLVSHKSPLHPEWLASYLPYAIVLGLGNQWAKAFKDRGVPAHLAWLVGTDQFDGSEVAALVAVLSSSGASHGSPGGGAGGAGGGGGSSGAG